MTESSKSARSTSGSTGSPAAADVRLTTTSYVVLGLVEAIGPATPYDLKQFAGISVRHFWTVPHTQLYAECERLAEAGLLNERREDTGRRRRFYTISAGGRRALETWRNQTDDEHLEMRDIGFLKLFFGADREQLAASQVAVHEARLAELLQISSEYPEMPEGMRAALEGGITYETNFVEFWQKMIDER